MIDLGCGFWRIILQGDMPFLTHHIRGIWYHVTSLVILIFIIWSKWCLPHLPSRRNARYYGTEDNRNSTSEIQTQRIHNWNFVRPQITYHLPLQAALPSMFLISLSIQLPKSETWESSLTPAFLLPLNHAQVLQFLFPKHLNPSILLLPRPSPSSKLHYQPHTQITIACAQLDSLPPVLPPSIIFYFGGWRNQIILFPQLNLPYCPQDKIWTSNTFTSLQISLLIMPLVFLPALFASNFVYQS